MTLTAHQYEAASRENDQERCPRQRKYHLAHPTLYASNTRQGAIRQRLHSPVLGPGSAPLHVPVIRWPRQHEAERLAVGGPQPRRKALTFPSLVCRKSGRKTRTATRRALGAIVLHPSASNPSVNQQCWPLLPPSTLSCGPPSQPQTKITRGGRRNRDAIAVIDRTCAL